MSEGKILGQYRIADIDKLKAENQALREDAGRLIRKYERTHAALREKVVQNDEHGGCCLYCHSGWGEYEIHKLVQYKDQAVSCPAEVKR